jgi:AcrR family transcriptional regulator
MKIPGFFIRKLDTGKMPCYNLASVKIQGGSIMSSYHHGNLREALIETGIRYVSDNGEESLSLRRISAACGVSHAAAYSHFADKNALLGAMRDYVTAQFTNVLEQTVQLHKTQPDMITHLGRSYVEFFAQSPHYFVFLFYRMDATIDLDHLEFSENYPPFELFKTITFTILNRLGLPVEGHLQALLAMWAAVHGLAAIAATGAVKYSGDWGAMTTHILSENILIKGMNHDERTAQL